MPQLDFFPSRSSEGRAALDIFYVDFNAVNFYVEDEDQENLYYEILRKRFPQVQFARIFPLGGKRNVLRHAEDVANLALPAKLIYIVDKDFDDYLERLCNDERVFYLERYCVENYFVDVEAVTRVIIETHPKLKTDEVMEVLNLVEWERKTIKALSALFILFYCVQKFELGLRNCDAKPEEYSVNKCFWSTDVAKIENYREQVIQACIGRGVLEEFQQVQQMMAKEAAAMQCLHGLVSGKFVMSMLFHYVKSLYKLGSITFDSFVFRVAKNSALAPLGPVMQRIEDHLSK